MNWVGIAGEERKLSNRSHRPTIYVSMSRRYHYPNRWLDDGRNYTMAQHVEDVAAFIVL